MLAFHYMPGHIYLFVGFDPSVLVADFIKEIKVENIEFINNKNWRCKNSAGNMAIVSFLIPVRR